MVTRNCKQILFELSGIEEKIKIIEDAVAADIPESMRKELLKKILHDYSIFNNSKAS